MFMSAAVSLIISNRYNKYKQHLTLWLRLKFENFPGRKFERLEVLDIDLAQNYLFGEEMQFIYYLEFTPVYR